MDKDKSMEWEERYGKSKVHSGSSIVPILAYKEQTTSTCSTTWILFLIPICILWFFKPICNFSRFNLASTFLLTIIFMYLFGKTTSKDRVFFPFLSILACDGKQTDGMSLTHHYPFKESW